MFWNKKDKEITKGKIKGKIAFCFNRDLPGIVNVDKNKGHYVYVREVVGDKCNVNVITSLEDKKHTFNLNKLSKTKKGYIYPVPIKDSNFALWSGINLETIKNVKVGNLNDIGKRHIKNRHKFFVGKFSK